MKARPLAFFVLLVLTLGSEKARSNTYDWTNAAGGSWDVGANWKPNGIPGAADTAFITNAGTYSVSLAQNTTVSSLTLGGTSGHQTLNIGVLGELTMSTASVVNTNGIVALTGGTLAGNAVINGSVNWTNGTFGAGNYAMTIGPNGVLTLTGTNGGAYIISEVVTNAGTLRIKGGTLVVKYCGGGQYGSLVNLPGALVDMAGDVSIGDDGCGSGIVNEGTVRKSAGTGTNDISGIFTTTGTVDAQTGTISLNGTGSGSGLFWAEPGAALALSSGTFTLTGNLFSSNAVLAGATLSGNSTISGVLNWTSGTFGSGNFAFTIATNGMVILAGTNGGTYAIQEAVTNAGIVRIESGNLQINYCGGGAYGTFINLPGALVDITTNASLGDDGCGSGIVNEGIVRKSGGTGVSDIYGVFNSTGTVDAQTGTISFTGTDSGSNVFAAEPGATLAFTSGTFAFNGNLVCSNVTLAGATLSGDGTITGLITWTSGIFGTGNHAMTLSNNATLILAGTNGGTYLIEQTVTNAGTIRVQSGNLQIDYCGGGQYGYFLNLPGALVDIAADVSIADDGCGSGIVNEGLVRKSAGTGVSDINGVFSNSGTVDAQTGTISFNGSDTGGGVFAAEPGATLALSSGTFTLSGNLTSSNVVLAGATLQGNGTISGVLNWTGGTFGAGDFALTVATNGTLVLAGTNGGTYLIEQAVTNAGIVRVAGGSLQIKYCGGGQYGTFVNLPGALLDMTTNVSIGDDGCGPGIVNEGTVRKSGGTGTNAITGVFQNQPTGTVDAQTGTISFNGSDSGGGVFAAETGATLEFSSGTVTVIGTLTSSNAVLAGANLSGNGSISGVLNWTSGIIGPGSFSMTVATNGTLVLAGTNGGSYLIEQTLNNAGIVRIQSGNLQIDYCGGGQYGAFLNLPGGLVDMPSDGVSIGDDGCGSGIVNEGTVRKSAGTGTNGISGVFLNAGTVDAETGTIYLSGNYSLAPGTLNAGITSLTNFGQIGLSGAAPLTGTIAAGLRNGFLPAIGNSFGVVTYGEPNGVFTNTALPPGFLWTTNYSSNVFTLLVTGVTSNLPPAYASNLSAKITGGQVLIQFTGATNASYSVLASTNIASSLTNWTFLGKATQINLAQFQFLDTNTNSPPYPQRFYVIRNP